MQYKLISEYGIGRFEFELCKAQADGWQVFQNLVATDTKSGIKYSILLEKEKEEEKK